MAQDSGASKGWYGVAAALALAGCVAGAAILWHAVGLLAQALPFEVPGTFAIELAGPGRYALWHDHATAFGGEVFAVDPRLPPGVRIRVVGPGGPVELARVSGSSTAQVGATERVQIRSFQAVDAGRHEIIVEGDFPRRVFSVGPDNLLRSVALMFGGIAAILFAVMAGGGLAVWVYFNRDAVERARTQPGGTAMTSETTGGPSTKGPETDNSMKQLTQVVYALQAASFLVGVSLIAAVIVNYVKREDVAGTLYESHFTWQIRTFWWSLLWGAIGAVLMIVVVGFAVLAADAIWFLYRVIKGWLRLSEGKPMYEGAK